MILIIQSARNVASHPRLPGYFHNWTDFALLAIFAVFTVEVVAKIIVSGLWINPPVVVEVPPPPPHETRPEATATLSYAEKSDDFGPQREQRRRQPSRSNTLDALSGFGDTLKRSAQRAIQAHEGPHEHEGSPVNPFGEQKTSADEALHQKHPSRDASGSTLAPFRPAATDSLMLRHKRVIPFAESMVAQRAQAPHYAFLRHSWNRIDLLAVLCFWVCFALAITRQETTSSLHLYIFRAVATLRCARLLTVTSGSATILASLKLAAPLLVNVAFFTILSLILLAIIGVQVFKGSYRRTCVWVPEWNNGTSAALQQVGNVTLSQLCGSYIDPSTNEVYGHIRSTGDIDFNAKGYQCALGLACIEGQSPNNGVTNFDGIWGSLLQSFIVMSANTWSGVMYNMIDANYFAAAIFFIVGLIITNFLMANLIVGVISNTFSAITSQTNRSAFAAEKIDHTHAHKSEHDTAAPTRRSRARTAMTFYKKAVSWSRWFWLGLITADLVLQASTDWTIEQDRQVVDFELWFAVAFDVEMLLRFSVYLLEGDWRHFFKQGRNDFDLFLAVAASITQAPPIKKSSVYPWLSVFSLARFYRVILAVPRMGPLLETILGSVWGMANMVLFVFLMVGLSALIAVQLFRGDIASQSGGSAVEITFKQIWNSFIGMYIVRSSSSLSSSQRQQADHCPSRRSSPAKTGRRSSTAQPLARCRTSSW